MREQVAAPRAGAARWRSLRTAPAVQLAADTPRISAICPRAPIAAAPPSFAAAQDSNRTLRRTVAFAAESRQPPAPLETPFTSERPEKVALLAAETENALDRRWASIVGQPPRVKGLEVSQSGSTAETVTLAPAGRKICGSVPSRRMSRRRRMVEIEESAAAEMRLGAS